MCDVLQIPRSTYYYEAKVRQRKQEEEALTKQVTDIFHRSRQNYGTRKIKVELKKQGKVVSRRRIGRIMKQIGLVSRYTVAQYRPPQSSCNEAKTANLLKREFRQEEAMQVLVSDLTYVRVRGKWHYICIFIDLFNREIVGHSSGPFKDAHLVYKALSSIQSDLNNVQVFHTDRGSEFRNKLIDEALAAFDIKRSLSLKGMPYDNAVAEATFKCIKVEFVKKAAFESEESLSLELFDYVNWFNRIRTHSTLGYLSPIEFKSKHLN
ncbi:transposase [Pontibacillus halophilus JSM 076056 = DSM 19796]|uniref:Transposase n=5 Tax=Pontibacillus TaxID=289201 RepID=A0A0A5G014_9BACI|nr:transposase [Pontibacillus halophilus JSM 076056 = DSM 19796]